MLIADYALLGLGGAVSCFAALRWERERAGRSLVLSFIGGVAAPWGGAGEIPGRYPGRCLPLLRLLWHAAGGGGGAPWDFLPLPLLPGDAGADGLFGGLRRPGLFVPGVPGGRLAAVLLQGGDAGWGQAGEKSAALCGLWPVPVVPCPGEELPAHGSPRPFCLLRRTAAFLPGGGSLQGKRIPAHGKAVPG